MIGTQFIELPVTMPPMLPGMVGVSNVQYFALYYQGSKATWSNGRGMGTFSYFACYEPLIEHIALAIHLEPYNLGSDDVFPEHAILCDCALGKMYVGAYKEIHYFLSQQHSDELRQFTEQEFEAAVKALQDMSFEQMQRLGMFEMFGNTNPQACQQTVEMVEWLDQQVTEGLIQHYIQLANRGNWTAMRALETLQRRISEARKQQ
ncbi:MAG: hypothetical protein JGK03_26100 [Microcoleus sp. PH2017_25_DOB_D_A]|uniref:hypothetical protein n=1 Tax=unclassified Microcoleus TaxID=2642155 RepID=UPI001DCD5D5D|nr:MULTISPECIES: hypothetical protein [unclassified Microcoleus]MCC3537577.1 hypothetical protein [Microcoleus sp. PH2017_25_DOB_D_A]MCC3549820.1 hypothetical protein [Microcoleus sp. PH2017_24_DOB_U_A]